MKQNIYWLAVEALLNSSMFYHFLLILEKEIFFVGKLLILVERYNWKIKAKHMLSGKGIDTVQMLPFLSPHLQKEWQAFASGVDVGSETNL